VGLAALAVLAAQQAFEFQLELVDVLEVAIDRREAASNMPGSRYFINGWTDPSGAFWVLGGTSVVFGGSGLTNDLWRYQP